MRLGFGLSGGGVPGVAAHLGFLSVLRDKGISPDIMVGASAGGLVVGMHACGFTIERQVSGWTKLIADPWVLLHDEALYALRLLRPSSAPGLFSLQRIVSDLLGGGNGQLKYPTLVKDWNQGFAVKVADYNARLSILISAGRYIPLAWAGSLTTETALTATAATPILFSGVRSPDGHLLQDGGVYDDDPVQAVRDMGADKVVLVRIGSPAAVPAHFSVYEMIRLAVQREIDAAQRASNPSPPDLLVTIPSSGSIIDFSHWKEDYSAGAVAALACAEQIQALYRT